jgi:hypothetical protein
MCGRFAQCFDVQATAYWLEAEPLAEVPPPRYNLALGSRILACRSRADGRRELASFHWGLIPGWAKDRKFGDKTFNARAETVAEKPSFRAAFRQRRCLIPADALTIGPELINSPRGTHSLRQIPCFNHLHPVGTSIKKLKNNDLQSARILTNRKRNARRQGVRSPVTVLPTGLSTGMVDKGKS